MSTTDYNVPLLRKIRDKIVDEPHVHKQGWWGGTTDPDEQILARLAGTPGASVMKTPRRTLLDTAAVDVLLTIANSRCTTSCCVAGWAVLLAPDGEAEKLGNHIPAVARDLLGLTINEAAALFDGDISTENMVDVLGLIVDDGYDVQAALDAILPDA